MKAPFLFLVFALSSLAHADVSIRKLPVCTAITYIEQVATAKQRNDSRALEFLVQQGHCFTLEAGTEYSIIDVNGEESPTKWVQLRVYGEDHALELYSFYGLL